MSRIALAAIAASIMVVIGPAQGSAEENLAKALELEETEGKYAEARALYEKIWKTDSYAQALRARGALGLARCMLVSGDLDGASAALARLAPLVRDNPDLKVRAKRLKDRAEAQRTGTADEGKQEEPIRKRVIQLIREGRGEPIIALGDAAVSTLKGIAEESIKMPTSRGVPEPRGFAVAMLIGIARPKAREAVLTLMKERKFADRAQILSNLSNRPTAEIGQLWTPVVVAGTTDPNRETRDRAAKLLRWTPNAGVEVWERILKDTEGSVRRTAFESLMKASTAPDSLMVAAFDRALSDSFLQNRWQAFRTLDAVKSRDWERYVELRERALKDADPQLRSEAYERIYDLPRQRRRELWLAGLDDNDPRVRAECLEGLQRAIVAEDVARVRPLIRDPSPDVRAQALSTLTGALPAEVVCDSSAAERLLIACAEERQGYIRQPALSILSRAGAAGLLPIFEPYLRSDVRSERHMALYFIMRLDLIQSLPNVLDTLGKLAEGNRLGYTDRNFQNHPAVSSLGPLGVVSWLRRGRHVDGAIALMRRADDMNTNYVDDAARMVANLVPPGRSREVLEAVKAVKDSARVSILIRNLSRYFGQLPLALDWYSDGLTSTDERIRTASAQALREHGDSSRVPALITALQKEQRPRVAATLSEAIANYATAAHVSVLQAALGSAEGHVQDSVIQTLGRIGTDAAVDILIERLGQEGSRAQVIQFLGSRKVARAATVLARLIGEDGLSDFDRVEAIRALGRIGDADVIDVILAAVKKHGDRVDDPRFHCGTTAGNVAKLKIHAGVGACFDLGRETFMAVAQRIVDGEFDDSVKGSVMTVLAFVPLATADEILQSGLKHQTSTVRTRAAYAVGHALLVHQSFALRDLIRDPNISVRRAATTALRRFVELGVTMK